MTLCSDSQGRSTSLSLHHPKTPPHRHFSKPYNSPSSPYPHSPTLPHPKFPTKSSPPPNQTPKSPTNTPTSPTLHPLSPLLSTLFSKIPNFPHKFHYFKPKISQISQNFSKINKIHTKFNPYFPQLHTSIPQNGCKNTFLKTSQTLPSKTHTLSFIVIFTYPQSYPQIPELSTDLSTGQKIYLCITFTHTTHTTPITQPTHILNRLHPSQAQITHVSDTLARN